jgi:hypothetical protein
LRPSISQHLSLLILWSLLVRSPFAVQFARAEGPQTSFTKIPVLPGEGLNEVLKRVPHISDEMFSEISDQIFVLNPEKLDAHGNFILSQPFFTLPNLYHPAPIPEARKPALLEMNPEPPRVQTKEGEEHSLFKFDLHSFLESSQLHSTSLSTGSELVLDSKPEYGLEVSAYTALAVNPNLLVGVNYKIAKTEFQDPDGQAFSESTSSMSELSGGVAYKISGDSVFSLNFGAAQTDHLTYLSDGSVQVDTVWLPKISASVENVWVRLGRIGIGTAFGAAVFLPSGLSTVGLSEEAKIFADYELGHHWMVGLEVGVGYQRQTFTNETHSLLSYGSALGIGLHL